MTATSTELVSTNCVACGRPLTDSVSITLHIGPECRADNEYFPDQVDARVRDELNRHLHMIAADQLYGSELRGAIFAVYTLGFRKLAQRIERRVHRRLNPVIDVKATPALEEQPIVPDKIVLPFNLTEGQDRAREMVHRLMGRSGFGIGIIAGYAGVGKSTMLRIFGDEYKSKGAPICIAPTGKAALRIREVSGLYASTVHRWLYAPGEDPATGAVVFKRREFKEIAVPASRLVILDEASMVGPDMWKDVYEVCKTLELRLVCIGDAFQLPPVMPPNTPPFSILFPEFAAHHQAERIEMTEVLRQARDNPIIRASMELRNGAGISSLRELRRVTFEQIAGVTKAVHESGGITICHRNATRNLYNIGIRQTLGIVDEQPQIGEPLAVLRNNYTAGLVNGETFAFDGWSHPPDEIERVYDKYKNVEELHRFGATFLPESRVQVILSMQQLHGKTEAGQRAIEIAASKYARFNTILAGDVLAPHVHVNFGYVWTAHRCVHPDTFVETERGLQRIRDIDPDGVIASATGGEAYENKFTTGRRKMVTVETRDGYSVTVTSDHRLFVWNGHEYAKKRACDIRPNDYVRIRSGIVAGDGDPQVRLHVAGEGDIREHRWRAPKILTRDVAELLGLIVADGTVTRRMVRLVKRHKDVVQRFVDLMRRVFGVVLRVRRNRGAKGGGAWMAECHSTFVCRWLLGFSGLHPNKKDVPQEVLSACLGVQARFLRGLFEDGYANTGRAKGDMIQWVNRSRAVVGTVQTMLLRFGIISNRSRGKGRSRGYGLLHIFGPNVRRFSRSIGFVATFKNDRIVGSDRDGHVQMVPCVRDDVWEFLSGYDRSNMQMRKREYGADTISAPLALQISRRTTDKRVRDELREAVTWHHTRVARVIPAGFARAMCVEVPGSHRFLQNGFDGSNSQGSQWPYVFVVLEPSVQLDKEDGRRWTYTAITRATQNTAVYVGRP